MKFLFLILVTFSISQTLLAAEIEGVKFEDKLKLDGAELVLNGVGLRQVTRYGFNVDVYVAGLYLKSKSSDMEAILKSRDRKRFVMQYVRSVDRKSLIDAYRKAYNSNCRINCDDKSLFTAFKDMVVSVADGDQQVFDFYKDKVVITNKGRSDKTVELTKPAYLENLLAIFIGKEPPTKEFKKGLLGQK